MGVSLKEYLLESTKNKITFFNFIESRGGILEDIHSVDLHKMIHDDLEFFFNLVRLYCKRNQQVGRIIILTELFNLLGIKITQGRRDTLSVYCDGFSEEEFISTDSSPLQQDTKSDYLLKGDDPAYDDFIINSKALLIANSNNKKKTKSETKNTTNEIEVFRPKIDAKYVITSIFEKDKQVKGSFYSLGAYTEDLMLREYPKYYPQGVLDYNEFIRSRQIEKVNLLLESDDSKDIAIYMKFMGENDLHSKFREDMQKVVIDLRDEKYKAMLDELDELAVHWDDYSEFSGVNYKEQSYDQEQVYNTIVSKLGTDVEKNIAKKMVGHMKDLYELKQNQIDKKRT